VIEFPPIYSEPKLLKKAVNWSKQNKYHIPSLSALAPKKDIEKLTELGRDWQKAGLGILMEFSEEGRRSVLFSLNETALSVVDDLQKQTIVGWLHSINRSEWIAAGAFVVSIIALFK
jgi:hypothetical protein